MPEDNILSDLEIPQENTRRQPVQERDLYHSRERMWRDNRSWITGGLIAFSLVLLAVVLLLAKRFDKTVGVISQKEPAVKVTETASAIRLELPFFDKAQYLVGKGVIAYMESDLSGDVCDVMDKHRGSGSDYRMDVGYPVTLNFDISALPAGYDITGLQVAVSENKAFDDPRVIPLNAEDRSASIYHLKTGQQYFFRIIVTISDGSEIFSQGTFRTEDTPRILRVDGIGDVRDIGSWKTVTGQTVKQGLLYRGSELDGHSKPEYTLTEKGKETMLDVLGIRTEIDLRWDVSTEPLGETVMKKSFPIGAYEEVFEENSCKGLKELFSQLADPGIYPAYIHCKYGKDQTGTAMALLEMLLGMDTDSVIRDYELSNLYHGEVDTERMEAFLQSLESYGETPAEQAENFLLSVGVTQEEIDSIRSIFLTELPAEE